VNGAWKLMKAGQEVGTADSPTATCGGKAQALGHWDVFVRDDTPWNGTEWIELISEWAFVRFHLLPGRDPENEWNKKNKG
jgi:hypothetical protein